MSSDLVSLIVAKPELLVAILASFTSVCSLLVGVIQFFRLRSQKEVMKYRNELKTALLDVVYFRALEQNYIKRFSAEEKNLKTEMRNLTILDTNLTPSARNVPSVIMARLARWNDNKLINLKQQN